MCDQATLFPKTVQDRYKRLGLVDVCELFPSDCLSAYRAAQVMRRALQKSISDSDLHAAISGKKL